MLSGVKKGILSQIEDAESTLNVLHAAYTSAANNAKIVSTKGNFDEILGHKHKLISFN